MSILKQDIKFNRRKNILSKDIKSKIHNNNIFLQEISSKLLQTIEVSIISKEVFLIANNCTHLQKTINY